MTKDGRFHFIFKDKGFSLVEILCVVAVVGILASMAIPSMPRFGADQHLKAAAFDFVMQLKELRSQAIHGQRGANVAPSEIRVTIHGVGPDATYVVRDGNEAAEAPEFEIETQFSTRYLQGIGPQFEGSFGVVSLVFTPDGKTRWECTSKLTKCIAGLEGNYSSYFSFSMRSRNTKSCHTIRISGLGLISSENGGASCEN